MKVERTFAMIKPDAVAKGDIGNIIHCIEAAGIKIIGLRMLQLDRPSVEHFYGVHKDRDFFPFLCDFMMTGPVVAMVLEGESVVSQWRTMMGPTDATIAGKDTIRGRFGESIRRNAVHGSDNLDHAGFEIYCFFKDSDLV